jgi:rubrerythrin
MGTKDEHYNLISVLYHALQGCETTEQYAQDAERGGDKELAEFFRRVVRENRHTADEGMRLLQQRAGRMAA